MKTKGLKGYVSEKRFDRFRDEEFNDLHNRVFDIEGDLQALLKYLDVTSVDYKKNRTGQPSHPWTYGRKIIKKARLES